MILKQFLLFLLLLPVVCLSAQDNKGRMALYNIGFGSIAGGVGAVIHKRPGEKWGKVFFKGLGQGALGGYVVYQSKNILSKVSSEREWKYSWHAKMVNSVGISIIENASYNKNFWEQYHLNIGFNRFEVHTKDRLKLKYRISPFSLVLTSVVALNNKFNFERSFQTGEFVFTSERTSGSNRGRAYGNVVLIKSPFLNDYDLYTHEFIHIYQYYDYNFVNSYLLRKKPNSLTTAPKRFAGLRKIMRPDLNALVLWPLYYSHELFGINNTFEYEANYWEN